MTSRHLVAVLLAVGAIVIALPADAAPAPPVDVSCRVCLVMDDRGRELWGRNAHERVAIASATKMVTALVVRHSADGTGEVTVSAEAAGTPGGKLSLEAGESFSVQELLYGLLMQSSNDAAVALAEHVAGSEEDFAALMNAYAGSLGAADTHFVTAHGLDEVGHYSSAADLVTIAVALLDDPLLARIVSTTTFTIEGSARTVTLENTNVLLETYPGAIGIKTGFTGDAGNVLVAAAERRGRRIITVAQGAVDHFADSRALLDYGFAVLARDLLLPAGRGIGSMIVDGVGATGIVTGAALRGLAPLGPIATRFAPREVVLPLEPGEVVGRVVVTSGDRVVGEVDALATVSLESRQEPWGSGFLSAILRTVGGILPGEG